MTFSFFLYIYNVNIIYTVLNEKVDSFFENYNSSNVDAVSLLCLQQVAAGFMRVSLQSTEPFQLY